MLLISEKKSHLDFKIKYMYFMIQFDSLTPIVKTVAL